MKDLVLSYYSKYLRLKSSDYDVNLPLFCLKSAYYHLFSKNIFAHHSTTIKGIRNIQTRGRLFVGTAPFDLWGHERTRLDILGKLVIEGDVSVGKGCHVIVHKGATCTLKEQCNITGRTNLNIGHRLEIGRGTTIAWGCEFLDRDGHFIQYEGKTEREGSIIIGDHVWIGSHVKILKGVHVANNSVVAAGSVLTKSFEEENVLIAGNPAKIVRRGVKWH
jgi:acetyltransferase-like isoleucine patch superfamily enzyme